MQLCHNSLLYSVRNPIIQFNLDTPRSVISTTNLVTCPCELPGSRTPRPLNASSSWLRSPASEKTPPATRSNRHRHGEQRKIWPRDFLLCSSPSLPFISSFHRLLQAFPLQSISPLPLPLTLFLHLKSYQTRISPKCPPPSRRKLPRHQARAHQGCCCPVLIFVLMFL